MTRPDIATTPEAVSSPTLTIVGARTTHELIRYFLASGIALAVDVGMLWFLTSVLSVSYLISGALAFLLGLGVVYVLSVWWVFERRTLRSPRTEFVIFLFIGIIGLGFNEVILWFLTGYAGFHYLFSKLASIFVVFSWNFGARKFLLFR